jgi:MFS family permease
MNSSFYLALLTAALGYFVDVYDIILFAVVRVSSLKELGFEGQALTQTGLMLLNVQLIGMVLGGLFWGILGDRRGRVSILFGSILLYSTANLINATVTGLYSYSFCRFFAGVGLAGEFGAGVTLISEMMSREKRGYGTMLIALCGVLGGITGGMMGDVLPWRWAYTVGGILGLGLLTLRWQVRESALFSELKESKKSRGNLALFFHSPHLLKRYVQCLFLGVPIWVFIGIFMTLSPEIGKALGLSASVSAGKAILFFNVGFGLGDLGSSLLSQLLSSRKKSIYFFLTMTTLAISIFLSIQGASTQIFYAACIFLGFGAGYWAVFMMITAEQFGTNLRATVATSLPNLVRGCVVPLSVVIQSLTPHFGLLSSLRIVGLGVVGLALLSLTLLRETYGIDLNFLE